MTNRDIRDYVGRFRKEFRLKDIGCAALRRIIEKQGYTVVEFNHIYNEENVAALIDSLHLGDMIARSNGFTYADSRYRLVFLQEDLSEAEKTVVLAHEEGHIFCGHISSDTVVGKDVIDEYEANEFAHYLLNPGKAEKLSGFLGGHKKALIALICAVLLGTAAAVLIPHFVAGGTQTERSMPGGAEYVEYYLTNTGFKYHRKDCVFVKNKDNTRQMTRAEFESGEYNPCGMCLPQENNG